MRQARNCGVGMGPYVVGSSGCRPQIPPDDLLVGALSREVGTATVAMPRQAAVRLADDLPRRVV
jgi:hypothetical protein